MEKFKNIFRKFLRTALKGAAAVTAALTFQSCPIIIIGEGGYVEYGMPPGLGWGEEVGIHGSVFSDTEEPIPGIHVTVQGVDDVYNRTDRYGHFYIFVPKQETMTIQFEDVDGEFNGGLFATKTVDLTFTLSDWDKYVDIVYLQKSQ